MKMIQNVEDSPQNSPLREARESFFSKETSAEI